MKKVILTFLATTAIILVYWQISYIFAIYVPESDFSAFYRAASIILDPSTPNTDIYSLSPSADYNQPEPFMSYRFSMAATYLLAPLALLPYYTAKTLLIFINFTSYFISVLIATRLGSNERRLTIIFAVLAFWLPFWKGVLCANINALMLLLITMGIYMATKKHSYLAGALIGFAALFKVFPLAIAMVLGLNGLNP